MSNEDTYETVRRILKSDRIEAMEGLIDELGVRDAIELMRETCQIRREVAALTKSETSKEWATYEDFLYEVGKLYSQRFEDS